MCKDTPSCIQLHNQKVQHVKVKLALNGYMQVIDEWYLHLRGWGRGVMLAEHPCVAVSVHNIVKLNHIVEHAVPSRKKVG